jgi:hypothetical protein
MKTNNSQKTGNIFRMGLAGLALVMATACNETMEDTLRYDYSPTGSGYENGHVLLVVMEGVAGRAVQTARNAYKTPNLKSMADHAIYTDYGLGDNTNRIDEGALTNERGWANLMIGNTAHGVVNDLDVPEGQETLFSRLVKDGGSASLYAADENIRRIFAVNSMNVPSVNTDEAVKNGVMEELKNTQTVPADLIVAQFKGVQDTGEAEGFYQADGTATDEVVNAIATLDDYIGEIWDALKARPHFKRENWLIAVTSNYGGTNNADIAATDHYGDVTRNTFTLLYNERLVSQVQGRPSVSSLTYSYNTPVYSFDYQNPNPVNYAESAVLNGNTSLGNLEFGQEMTIMFFIKPDVVPNGSDNYTVLSKVSRVRQNGGWYICFYSNPARGLLLELGNQSSDRNGTSTLFNTAGEWHSFAVTFAPNAANTNMVTNVYVDGKLDTYRPNRNISKANFTNYMNGMQDIPLRIGGTNDRATQVSGVDTRNATPRNSFNITNIQFYDKALTAEEILKYAGKNQLHLLAESYPLWDNLVGYWPCDLEEDGGAPVLKDYSKYRASDGSTDFRIDRGATNKWTEGFSNNQGIHPIPESDKFYYNKTINTVDISRQTLLWLGKNVGFDMEGRAWQLTYNEMTEK